MFFAGTTFAGSGDSTKVRTKYAWQGKAPKKILSIPMLKNTRLENLNYSGSVDFGTGYGFGIDYDFAANAGLFLRHRWMEHRDENFSLDKFKGTKMMVELKLFF